eukprot:5102078-Pleurochrysis_carterae.AAC.6
MLHSQSLEAELDGKLGDGALTCSLPPTPAPLVVQHQCRSHVSEGCIVAHGNLRVDAPAEHAAEKLHHNGWRTKTYDDIPIGMGQVGAHLTASSARR